MTSFHNALVEPCFENDICEKELLLGATGVCNLSTGVCECPDGFSGKDDFAAFNACFVNKNLQRSMWIAALSFACLAGVVNLVTLFHLLRKFNYVADVKKLVRTWTQGSISVADKEKEIIAATTPSQVNRRRARRKEVVKRQRLVVASMALGLSFNIGVIMIYGSLLQGEFRFEGAAVQDVGLFLASTTLLYSIWLNILAFYRQLPPLKVYGRLFGVDSILIRRPRLIKNSAIIRAVVLTISFFMITLGFRWIKDDFETQTLMDTLVFVFFAVASLDLLLFALWLIYVLRGLFLDLYKLSHENIEAGTDTSSDSRIFEKALKTIRLQTTALCATVPAIIIICLLATFHRPVRTRIHVTLPTIVTLANIGILFNCYLFLRRIGSSKKSWATSPTPSKDSLDVPVAAQPSDEFSL